MSQLNLPGYTPSAPAPTYSPEPACNEQTLDRRPCRSALTGTYTKKSKHIALVLDEQEENVQIPSYGRHALVSGTIHLEDCESIREVVVKLDGKLDLTISEGGSVTIQTVHDSHTLWTFGNSRDPCPATIPFSLIFPSMFNDGTLDRPLPPSYDASFPGVHGLFIKSYYTLTVVVVKSGYRRIAFWTNRKSLRVRVRYYPRTRPYRPSVSNPCLFSTIKYSPEEWQQILCQMTTRPLSNVEPIECHFFVPSVQIFALSDTIPFHVQLIGSIASLRHFLPPLTPEPDTSSTQTHPHAKTKKQQPCIPAKPTVRVYLLRQISAKVRSQKAWRDCRIGEGKIWPVPPGASYTHALDSDSDSEECLDWEGEVRCREDVTIGGFNASKAVVKDFIVLSLCPPNPQDSPLLEVQYAHPIRLVTDPWVDTTIPQN